MTAFTDIRNDDGRLEMIPFEYDEQAEIAQEIKDRLDSLDRNADVDELYGELDQLVFEFKDETDVIEQISSYILKIEFCNLDIAFEEVMRDLKIHKKKVQNIVNEVTETIRRLA